MFQQQLKGLLTSSLYSNILDNPIKYSSRTLFTLTTNQRSLNPRFNNPSFFLSSRYLSDSLKKSLDETVKNNDVVLFMKGTPMIKLEFLSIQDTSVAEQTRTVYNS
nr:3739_t:CDS:2 [Entrophospora candida]